MIITVKVKASSKRNKVEKQNDTYVIYVKAPAEKGKANSEVIKLLRRFFKRNVRIIKGVTSKTKIIEVDDAGLS